MSENSAFNRYLHIDDLVRHTRGYIHRGLHALLTNVNNANSVFGDDAVQVLYTQPMGRDLSAVIALQDGFTVLLNIIHFSRLPGLIDVRISCSVIGRDTMMVSPRDPDITVDEVIDSLEQLNSMWQQHVGGLLIKTLQVSGPRHIELKVDSRLDWLDRELELDGYEFTSELLDPDNILENSLASQQFAVLVSPYDDSDAE